MTGRAASPTECVTRRCPALSCLFARLRVAPARYCDVPVVSALVVPRLLPVCLCCLVVCVSESLWLCCRQGELRDDGTGKPIGPDARIGAGYAITLHAPHDSPRLSAPHRLGGLPGGQGTPERSSSGNGAAPGSAGRRSRSDAVVSAETSSAGTAETTLAAGLDLSADPCALTRLTVAGCAAGAGGGARGAAGGGDGARDLDAAREAGAAERDQVQAAAGGLAALTGGKARPHAVTNAECAKSVELESSTV